MEFVFERLDCREEGLEGSRDGLGGRAILNVGGRGQLALKVLGGLSGRHGAADGARNQAGACRALHVLQLQQSFHYKYERWLSQLVVTVIEWLN